MGFDRVKYELYPTSPYFQRVNQGMEPVEWSVRRVFHSLLTNKCLNFVLSFYILPLMHLKLVAFLLIFLAIFSTSLQNIALMYNFYLNWTELTDLLTIRF
jgi:hypothetical protein